MWADSLHFLYIVFWLSAILQSLQFCPVHVDGDGLGVVIPPLMTGLRMRGPLCSGGNCLITGNTKCKFESGEGDLSLS
jgi:hypothetical protein